MTKQRDNLPDKHAALAGCILRQPQDARNPVPSSLLRETEYEYDTSQTLKRRIKPKIAPRFMSWASDPACVWPAKRPVNNRHDDVASYEIKCPDANALIESNHVTRCPFLVCVRL